MKTLSLLLALLISLTPVASAKDGELLEYLVMIYLCGTDLETRFGAATGDLQEMLDANLPDDGSVSVLIQTGGTQMWDNDLVDSATSQRYLLWGEGIVQIGEDLGQLDMGDPDTLSDFIAFGLDQLPAKRTALILWDHGSGATGGVCYDELTQNSINARELAGALEQSLSPARTQLDFIGFDACLMASFEMANHLKPYTRYMIASEELEPGSGWAYDPWLNALGNNPNMDTRELGQHIVDSFIDVSLRYNPDDYVTLSVVDLSKMDALSQAVDAVGSILSQTIDHGGFTRLSRTRSGMRTFGDFHQSTSDMVDLGALATHYASFMPEEAQQLVDTIADAVVYSRNSANIPDACGLSILLPEQSTDRADEYMRDYDLNNLMPQYTQFLADYLSMLTGSDYSFSLNPLTQTALSSLDSSIYGFLGSLLGGGQQSPAIQPTAPMPDDDDYTYDYDYNYDPDYDCDYEYDYDPDADYDYDYDYENAEDTTDSVGGFFDNILSSLNDTYGESAYTLQLSSDDLEHLSHVEATLLQAADEQYGEEYGPDVYFDFGLMQDVAVDWDTGMVYGLFDGYWPTLNGQMVSMTDQIVSETYTRSIIPAMVNDDEQYLIVIFNEQNEHGLVVGYSEGYDQNNNPMRGYTELTPGDVVTPMYDLVYWDENDDMQSVAFIGQDILVEDHGLYFEYAPVEAATYFYALCLNDVFGGYEYTDFIELDYT